MDPSRLKPGDPHYMAYVGPPTEYDFMGATQFRLLCALGLRAKHSLLDVGCGSLRAGRFLISYLDQGNYYGIEPNKWLIDEAVRSEIGNDLLRLKKPRFHHNSDFLTDVFEREFDFILAQSIFSHAGLNIIRSALTNFGKSLRVDGLIVATFVEGQSDSVDEGWLYPGCVSYRPTTIKALGEDHDLFVSRIPWFHPRQQWYLFARQRNRLPTTAMMRHLTGAVLFDSELGFDSTKVRRFGPFCKLRGFLGF